METLHLVAMGDTGSKSGSELGLSVLKMLLLEVLGMAELEPVAQA